MDLRTSPRLARALCQTATELDAAYARAQEAGRELRGRLATGTEGDDDLNLGISSADAELELMLERCEVIDTALMRLSGVYQGIGREPRRARSRNGTLPTRKWRTDKPCGARDVVLGV
jgi:hypothetical protein